MYSSRISQSDLRVSRGGWSVAGYGEVRGGLTEAAPRTCDNAANSDSGWGSLPGVITERAVEQWDLELNDLFVTIGHRFGRVELRRRMRDYVPGLLAPVARKNSWQLAEQAGHATPDGLQHLLAGAKWEPDDIRDELYEYVAADKLGEDGGVLIIDDTGFVKKGTTSAGVQRQYSGTAGRTENCQIGVFAAYATSRGRALADRELYLPKSWSEDRERCRTAKIPGDREFATKSELARRMVLRAICSPLPITWVTADSATDRRVASADCWSSRASATCWPCPSPSSPWVVRVSRACSHRLRTRRGQRSHAETAKGPRVYHWAAVRLPVVAEFDYQGEVPHRMRWALARRSIRKPDEIATHPGRWLPAETSRSEPSASPASATSPPASDRQPGTKPAPSPFSASRDQKGRGPTTPKP